MKSTNMKLQQGVEHLSPVMLDLKYFASVFCEQIASGIYVIAWKIVGKKAIICNLQLSKKITQKSIFLPTLQTFKLRLHFYTQMVPRCG